MKYLLLLGCLILQGCGSYLSLTSSKWEQAFSHQMYYPQIKGVVMQVKNQTEPRSYMIIEYRINGFWIWDFNDNKFYIAIPMSHDKLCYPFELDKKNNILKIDDLPSTHEINMVEKYQFQENDFVLGKKLIKSHAFIRTGFSNEGITTKNNNIFYISDRHHNLSVIPYWWGRENLEPCYQLDKEWYVSDKCQIAMFPYYQERNNTERNYSIFLTVLETPFTVVADIVIVPTMIAGAFLIMALHGC